VENLYTNISQKRNYFAPMENQEKESRSRWKVTIPESDRNNLIKFSNKVPALGITIRTIAVSEEEGIAQVEFCFRRDSRSMQNQSFVHFMLLFNKFGNE